MAKLIMGDREIEIPVFNFKKLKKAWPLFKKVANVDPDNPMSSFDDAISVILVGLQNTEHADLTRDDIEDELRGDQVLGLQKTVTDIMKDSGLVTVSAEGKAEPVAESPESSTETSTPSSLNSSPLDASPEVGTE